MILRDIISGRDMTELLDETTPKDLPGCGHGERLSLLNSTMDSAQQAATLYGANSGGALTSTELGVLSLSDIKNLGTGYWRGIGLYITVYRNLQRDMLSCAECRIARGENAARATVVKQATVNQNRSGNSQDIQDNIGVGGTSDEDDEVDGTFNPHHHLLATSSPLPGDQCLVIGRAVAQRSGKEIQAYKFQETRSVGQCFKFDKNFDDYHTGPTAEEAMERFCDIQASYTLTPHISILDTMHIRFDDQGHRRTAGGFQHFYNNPPSIEEQLVHFFPTPPEGVLSDRKKRLAAGIDANALVSEAATGPFPTSEIHGNDLLVWGLDDILDRAGESVDAHMKPYITGRTNTVINPDHYIRFDPLLSRKTVDDVRISVDVDSVIWLTDKLKVKAAVNIHLLPSTEPEAPISKNNHTYVELYPPRTDAEKAKGHMSGQSLLTPISSIPNMHFAHTGNAEGYANITIIFPRMKHKHPLRTKWETKIPYEVQEFWLRKVLYPALHQITTDGVGVYTQGELEDVQFKFKGSEEKTLQIRGPHLTDLVANIHQILRNKQGSDFDGYRSFFFVLDIRGIKASTSCDKNSSTDPWTTLLAQHPSLDWEYMESGENGELLIDIGVGFHPPAGSELVGFWSMDALQVGFEYGGYGTGTRHSVSTVSAIGGIHANMPKDRRLRTHILYRLAYNLSYEVLRGHKTRTKTGFFPARSAYMADKDFVDSVEAVVCAYERSLHKSYGVRDEYRCRASSARRLLPYLRNKVSFAMLPTKDLRTQVQILGKTLFASLRSNCLALQREVVYLYHTKVDMSGKVPEPT